MRHNTNLDWYSGRCTGILRDCRVPLHYRKASTITTTVTGCWWSKTEQHAKSHMQASHEVRSLSLPLTHILGSFLEGFRGSMCWSQHTGWAFLSGSCPTSAVTAWGRSWPTHWSHVARHVSRTTWYVFVVYITHILTIAYSVVGPAHATPEPGVRTNMYIPPLPLLITPLILDHMATPETGVHREMYIPLLLPITLLIIDHAMSVPMVPHANRQGAHKRMTHSAEDLSNEEQISRRPRKKITVAAGTTHGKMRGAPKVVAKRSTRQTTVRRN